jgi:hypothetical protein
MDAMAWAQLLSSIITAGGAIFISFLALQHSARPRIDVRMDGAVMVLTETECRFTFSVINIGHWYASPAALDVTVYCNFEPTFCLKELRYGSAQELTNDHVRVGKRGLLYIRAKHIKLAHKGEAERVDVFATTPNWPGRFRIEVTAFSENGGACHRSFWINVTRG